MNDKVQTFFNFFLRNNKLRSYLFFFIISGLLWFFSNMSQQYKSIVAVPVIYTDVPESILQENLPIDTLYIDILANGYQVLKLKMIDLVLKVDYKKEELYKKKTWQTNEYSNEINSLIGEDNTVLHIYPKQIDFKLNKIRKKKVKILPNVQVKYRLGYKNKTKLRLSYDSVWVFGLQKKLDTLMWLTTNPLELQDVCKNISGDLPLFLPDGIKVNIKKVQYSLSVDQFISASKEIGFTLINVPDEINVVLFPKKSIVKYKVFKTDFQKVRKKDLKLVLDFSKRDSVLYPNLINTNLSIFDVSIYPKQVAFLIKNR